MEPDINPKETALLIIDMQNGFCHDDGALAKAGRNIQPMKSIIPKVKQLVNVCRSVNIPVIWSQQEHYATDVTRKLHKIQPHYDRLPKPPCLKGTWDAEILDELKGEIGPSDEIIKKHRSSCFYSTRLEALLRISGISMLVICGTATHYCVENTVRDAYARDYDIIIIEDCVAGSDPELHNAALKNFRYFYGLVLSLKQFEESIKKLPLKSV